jgi:hypothetical protein
MLKLIMLVVLGLGLILLTALLGTLFFYTGWNWGVVPAVSFAKEVSLAGAFWLSLCISAIGSMFKSSLTINKDEK